MGIFGLKAIPPFFLNIELMMTVVSSVFLLSMLEIASWPGQRLWCDRAVRRFVGDLALASKTFDCGPGWLTD